MRTPESLNVLKTYPTAYLNELLVDIEQFIPQAIEDHWPLVCIQDQELFVTDIKCELARRGEL
jgi:hypothetical protein